VVSDSPSMVEEQEKLAEGFDSFISQLDGQTDFHVGLLSASFDPANPDAGQLVAADGQSTFLTADDEFVRLFQERVRLVGLEGAGLERGLESAQLALSPNLATGVNEGFLRLEAELHIIFVSDGDDCIDCDRSDEAPVSQYVESFRSIKSDHSEVQVKAIVGLENNPCDRAYPATRYIAVATKTGGSSADICTSSWSDIMGDLGHSSTGVRASFQTSFAADIATLEVFVDELKVEEHETEGWTYDPETRYITFGADAVPDLGSEIYAVYSVLPAAGQSSTLSRLLIGG